MKYLRYLLVAAVIDAALFPFLVLLMGWPGAGRFVIVITPLSLWSARLIVAVKSGTITRRMPMLDGGPTMRGMFWIFRPDVYVREEGFDYFKGYVFKEAMCCLLLWIMFATVPISHYLGRGAG